MQTDSGAPSLWPHWGCRDPCSLTHARVARLFCPPQAPKNLTQTPFSFNFESHAPIYIYIYILKLPVLTIYIYIKASSTHFGGSNTLETHFLPSPPGKQKALARAAVVSARVRACARPAASTRNALSRRRCNFRRSLDPFRPVLERGAVRRRSARHWRQQTAATGAAAGAALCSRRKQRQRNRCGS